MCVRPATIRANYFSVYPLCSMPRIARQSPRSLVLKFFPRRVFFFYNIKEEFLKLKPLNFRRWFRWLRLPFFPKINFYSTLIAFAHLNSPFYHCSLSKLHLIRHFVITIVRSCTWKPKVIQVVLKIIDKKTCSLFIHINKNGKRKQFFLFVFIATYRVRRNTYPLALSILRSHFALWTVCSV